jgi:hypothetical protein
MLLPGSAAIAATAGLATGRVGELATGDASRFLVFLQVELLALGIGRLGYDQLVLSRASVLSDADELAFTGLLLRMVMPFALVCAALAGAGLGGWAGIAVLVAAPIDVVSTVTGSFELGRRKYLTNIAFSWMNYPVFLFFLVVPGVRIDSSQLVNVLALFCSTSIARGLVALVVLARHRRRRAGVVTSRPLRVSDLAGAGSVSVSQVLIQRVDGIVLALFGSAFSAASISSYLVATRLLDASYTVSAVAGSLQQVAQTGAERPGREARGWRSLILPGLWVGLWLGGAGGLAVLQWPDVLRGWGRIALAVPAAALYLATFRLVLRELAGGRNSLLARRFVVYVAVAAAFASVAVVTGEPAVMILAMIVTGSASASALSARPDSVGSLSRSA